MVKNFSRQQLFWLCQCGGWAVYAVLTELMIKIPSQEPWQVNVPHLLLDTSFGFGVTLLLRSYYKRFSQQSTRKRIYSHLAVLLLG